MTRERGGLYNHRRFRIIPPKNMASMTREEYDQRITDDKIKSVELEPGATTPVPTLRLRDRNTYVALTVLADLCEAYDLGREKGRQDTELLDMLESGEAWLTEHHAELTTLVAKLIVQLESFYQKYAPIKNGLFHATLTFAC